MENNGSSKVREITESLRRVEEMEAKKFMKQTDEHFQITSTKESEYQKLSFVAQKSFRHGFQRGMMAVFDAMDEYRKKTHGME